MPGISIKSYPTLPDVVRALGFRCPDVLTEEDWTRILMENMGDLGIWGFVDASSTLHYWMAPDCPVLNKMEFLGHEIAHLQGIEDEQHAQSIGEITRMAYLALQMLSPEKDKASC